MIKALIVDDSPVARQLLDHILSADPEIRVVGFANDGEEAVELARRTKPDVITMDICMPKLNGYEATRRIMETCPTPIVVVSASWRPEDVDATFRSIEAGAVAVVQKPVGIGHPDYERAAQELVQTVRLMSEVKVITRRPRPAQRSKTSSTLEAAPTGMVQPKTSVVAIGVSTGGPPVLQTVLSLLPQEFPAPILVVQHIASGFLGGMVEWLDRATALSVKIATDGEPLERGHVYFAPDGLHMGVTQAGHVTLSSGPRENSMRPSASFLFRSVAAAFGRSAVGVLLTGMGRDGAEELKLLRDTGAVTVAQDEASSVVYGMPGEAARLGAATHILPPDQVAAKLRSLTGTEIVP